MTYQIWVRVNGKQMLQTATNDRERARVQFVEQGGSDSIFKPCLVTIKPECEKAMFFDLKREDKVE